LAFWFCSEKQDSAVLERVNQCDWLLMIKHASVQEHKRLHEFAIKLIRARVRSKLLAGLGWPDVGPPLLHGTAAFGGRSYAVVLDQPIACLAPEPSVPVEKPGAGGITAHRRPPEAQKSPWVHREMTGILGLSGNSSFKRRGFEAQTARNLATDLLKATGAAARAGGVASWMSGWTVS